MFDSDLKGGVKDLFLKGHRCSLEILRFIKHAESFSFSQLSFIFALLCEILELMIVVLLICKHINYPFTSLYQYAYSSYYSELHISFGTDKENLCFNHSFLVW